MGCLEFGFEGVGVSVVLCSLYNVFNIWLFFLCLVVLFVCVVVFLYCVVIVLSWSECMEVFWVWLVLVF